MTDDFSPALHAPVAATDAAATAPRAETETRDDTAARTETAARTDADAGSVRMPAIYLGHGAPMLLDDELWPAELSRWAAALPRPKQILIVSAHWQSAPLTLGAVTPAPLVYDFYGFPERYYRIRYDSPGAPELAARVKAAMAPGETVAERPTRGLDHGAYVPLIAMYPEADVPVLQMSMPDLGPEHLFELGRRLAPLRDEGVLIVGSGFMTHGLQFIDQYWDGRPGAPEWSREFDLWAAERLAQGDLDAMFDFRNRAPGMPYAHPTVEHFAPLFVALGAATNPEDAPKFTIEGYWLGLAKRSFQVK